MWIQSRVNQLVFLVTIILAHTPQYSLELDDVTIAAVSIGKSHTRLRVIRDSPKTLMNRLNTLRKGGKTEDIAHASLAYHQWTALEHDFRRQEFFIIDRKAQKLLVAVDSPGYINKTRVLYEGISHKVTATAYDWIRREYYWGDPSFQAIFRLSVDRLCRGTTCMTSLSTRRQGTNSHRRQRHMMASLETVVGEDVYKPYGMAVDPVNGFLYWSDDGQSRSIYSCTLEGEKRNVLVTNLIKPSGLTLDYKQNRLFWVERMSTFSTISSCQLDKKTCFPKRVTSIYSSQLYDLDYFKDSLVMSDHFNRLVLYDEDSGQLLRQHWLGKSQGVNICARDRQVYKDGPNYQPHQPPSGLVFSDVITNGLILLASDKSGVLMVDRTFFMGSEPTLPYQFLREVGITTMAVDVRRRQLFFFKRPDKTIHRVTIPIHVNESRVPVVITVVTSWIDDVTAMAVDWSSGNLYWLDSGYRRLMMTNSLGQFPTVIHYQEISRPQDLVIHSERKLLFWSDMSDPEPRIERSRLDGRHRRIILGKKDFYERPHALALDLRLNRLYWSDGPFLCRSTLNGKLVEECKPRDLMARPAIKAIDIMHDYVLWTDFIGGLRSADTDGEFPLPGSHRRDSWFADNYYSDVIYVHTSKQPIVEDSCQKHRLYPERLIGPRNTSFTLEDAVKLHQLKAKAAKAADGSTDDGSGNKQGSRDRNSIIPAYGSCSQLCIPTTQVPKCVCAVGYWRTRSGECVPGVTRDSVLVMADVQTGWLFRQFSLLPHYYIVPMFGDTRASDVTLDEDAEKIFWLDDRRHTNMILSADFDGKRQAVVLAGTEFSMTKIKTAFDLIYILTSSGQLFVLCLRSGLFTDVINDEDIVVNSLFIDKINRYLYFSATLRTKGPQHSVFVLENTEGVLMRSNLDGSQLQTVYKCRGQPLGVAVHEQHLYWIDREAESILSIPLHTPNSTASNSTTKNKHYKVLQQSESHNVSSTKYGDKTRRSHPPFKATPIIPNTVDPRVVIQLEATSKPREIVITPDGDIFFTDDTKQALQQTHVSGQETAEDAGYPYLNKIGGIAFLDSRNKLNRPLQVDNSCSGIAIPLPGNQEMTSCLCNSQGTKQLGHKCKNKMQQTYRITAHEQGLCLVTALDNGKVEGFNARNYVMSGQHVTVTCSPGYALTDQKTSSEIRKCQEGRWNSTASCRKALDYHIHGNTSRGYVVFTNSTNFYVPRDVTRVDVIAIGGGGGGYDPCNRDLFGQRSRAGMGGVSKFGYYLRAHGGLGGTEHEGGRGGRSRSLFGGTGGDSSACLGGGAAGETSSPEICRLASTSCMFCGAGGALVKCNKCPVRPGGCSGGGSTIQAKESADYFGGGATGMNGGWGGGGGGYSRKSVRVSPFEKVEVKVGKRGFPSARPAADGVVVVAWGDVIDNLVKSDGVSSKCKSFVYEDRLVSKHDKCPDGDGQK